MKFTAKSMQSITVNCIQLYFYLRQESYVSSYVSLFLDQDPDLVIFEALFNIARLGVYR